MTIRPAICDKARKKQQGKNSDQIFEEFGVHLLFLAENSEDADLKCDQKKQMNTRHLR